MHRLPGPTLLTALFTAEIDMSSVAGILADLHHRLRRIPARASRDPVLRVLHLDPHLGNVLLGPDGSVLIDWRNSAEGAPDLDAAMSALILAQATVGDDGDLLMTARSPARLPGRRRRPATAGAGLCSGPAQRRHHLTHRAVIALSQAEELVRRYV